MKNLLSYEVGSLAKPSWRVKAFANKPITKADVDDANRWGKLLHLDHESLLEILKDGQTKNLDAEAKAQISRWSSKYAVKFFEQAGLDVVYDGEQQRTEMYHYAIARTKGFEFRGLVKSFDNKYYEKAACVASPKMSEPFHVDEFSDIQSYAKHGLKVPITGAYTLADWSFDECYGNQALQLGTRAGKEKRQEARRQFVLEIAKNVIRPNLQALLAAGANWIQIDEPAVTTEPSEVPLFVESFNESVRGLKGQFSIHLCYSDYTLLFPHLEKLENCLGVCVGFSNNDSNELGTKDQNRPGFKILKEFAKLGNKLKIGVGVLDIHKDEIEPVALIKDRIRYAIDTLGADNVHVCPDCGLRTRTWDVAYRKLCHMTEAIQGIG